MSNLLIPISVQIRTGERWKNSDIPYTFRGPKEVEYLEDIIMESKLWKTRSDLRRGVYILTLRKVADYINANYKPTKGIMVDDDSEVNAIKEMLARQKMFRDMTVPEVSQSIANTFKDGDTEMATELAKGLLGGILRMGSKKHQQMCYETFKANIPEEIFKKLPKPKFRTILKFGLDNFSDEWEEA